MTDIHENNTIDDQNGGLSDIPEKKEKKYRLLPVISYLSLIIVPLLIIVAVILFLLTSGTFYTSILKHSDLVRTSIYVTKWQTNETIRREIEEKTGLEAFKEEYKSIERNYEQRRDYYNNLNKTGEYDRLKQQRDELYDLSWKKAPAVFKSKDEFKKYRKEELDKLDRLIDEIKDYRWDNRGSISNAEDAYEDAEDAYEDARSLLKEKEEAAHDITLSHENSLLGQVYADMEIITPPLTEVLNEKLINGPVKEEINKAIDFITSYFEQVKAGNVYRNAFALTFNNRLDDNLRVRLPGFSISLWVEDQARGILQKRHLFSEVFVDIVRGLPNLKKRDTFINLFRFSESSMAENLGRAYLKNINLTIVNGVIRMEPVELSGDDARVMETVMRAATWGNYIKYVLPALVLGLFLIMALSGAPGDKKYRAIKRVLVWPSVLCIGICSIAVIASFFIGTIVPGYIENSVMEMYIGRFVPVLVLHIMVPMIVVFVPLLVIGIIMGKNVKQETTLPDIQQ